MADPWIGHILDGSKTWEMRSRSVSFRGWFGLIRKGSGAVQGVAHLIDVGAPLSQEQMLATVDLHRIPEEMIRAGEVDNWNTPWVLADVRRLATPVPYRHRSGAVTWVALDPDVTEAIAAQLGGIIPASPQDPAVKPAPAPAPLRKVEKPKTGAPTPQPAPASFEPGALIGQSELTQGNIDNNHIYLRSFFDRFPEDAVGGSNRHEKAPREVSIDWGGGAPVQSDLDGKKRFFRARGWIRTFFELNDAQPGDVVQVEQTAPYAYRVRLTKRNRTAT